MVRNFVIGLLMISAAIASFTGGAAAEEPSYACSNYGVQNQVTVTGDNSNMNCSIQHCEEAAGAAGVGVGVGTAAGEGNAGGEASAGTKCEQSTGGDPGSGGCDGGSDDIVTPVILTRQDTRLDLLGGGCSVLQSILIRSVDSA